MMHAGTSSRLEGRPEPARRTRLGIVGLGIMGRNHLRNALERHDVVVAGVADPSPEARSHVAAMRPGGLAWFRDAQDLLADTRLDALIVAVPTHAHLAAATAAIEAGIAVLVEKPIARTSAEGWSLVERAERAGTPVMVGHVERANPGVTALAGALRAGALSRIHSVRAVRSGPFPDRPQDAGVAIDLATHDIDVMCHLLGELPSKVVGVSLRYHDPFREDLVSGTLTFPSGALGSIDADWLSPSKQRRLTVLGPEGRFELDYLSQTLTFTRAGDAAPVYLDGFAPTLAGDTTEVPVSRGEPLAIQLDGFVAAVRDGAPTAPTAREGLLALRVAEGLLESAEAGHAIDPWAGRPELTAGIGPR